MNQYYIVTDGLQLGPFSIEELRKKRILPSTLVWTEHMENWTQAKNIDVLKEIITISPPPIPQKHQKTIKFEAEISKKKNPETPIIIAKEIKINIKIILFSTLLGIILFISIFVLNQGFQHILMVDKFDNLHVSDYSKDYEGTVKFVKKSKELAEESIKLGYSNENGDSILLDENSGTSMLFNFEGAKLYHENAYKNAADNSMTLSLVATIILSIVLIIGRYIFEGIKWVNTNSKKEVVKSQS